MVIEHSTYRRKSFILCMCVYIGSTSKKDKKKKCSLEKSKFLSTFLLPENRMRCYEYYTFYYVLRRHVIFRFGAFLWPENLNFKTASLLEKKGNWTKVKTMNTRKKSLWKNHDFFPILHGLLLFNVYVHVLVNAYLELETFCLTTTLKNNGSAWPNISPF